MCNATINDVFITPTIPPGREMLVKECEWRGLDKRTLKPLNPRTCYMVLFASNPKAMDRPGVITIKPEDFIRKYWVGKELKDPTDVVTFVGYTFTINGKLSDLVEWAKTFT